MKTKVLISILLAISCQTLPAQRQQGNATFANPMLFADVPDMDIIRVDNMYYMVSTTMHFAPGCGIMKSKDLVNWEIVNYAYDELDEGDNFRLLNGKNEYSQGSWAANLRYDPYEKMYYMIMTCNTTGKTFYNCSLTYSRLTDYYRIIFCTTAKHLHNTADFFITTNYRVNFILACSCS